MSHLVSRARIDSLVQTARSNGVRIALISMFDVENNAIRLLAALLRERGHHVVEVFFKDWISNHLPAPTEADLDALVEILTTEEISLAAISIRASAYFQPACLLSRTLHERLNLAVLMGGMHPTLMGDQCMEEADWILQGEAETSLGQLADCLAKGLPFDEVPNLWLPLPDGTVKKNPNAPLIQDLDTLPFRDYVSHAHKYFIWQGGVKKGDPMRGDPVFQMMASRGCIYKCSFCYNSTYKKDVYPGEKWYRTRSVDSTIAEINAARKHWDFKSIRFDDEVFNPHRPWLVEFCERFPKEVGLPFEIFIEPKLVDEEKMRLLKDAGLTGVYMGIQASERVTGHLYDRRVKNNSLHDIAILFKKLSIYPHYQLIFDDPASTDGDRRALFNMISEFPSPFDLYLFSMTVFPGSELNNKLLDSGVISEWDIEGVNTRTFYQHRVNLRYPRPVEETFWISLIVMLSKGWMPRPLLRKLSHSQTLKKHPWPLIQMAHATNVVKMGSMAAKMTVDGKMTPTLLRRWLSLNRTITA